MSAIHNISSTPEVASFYDTQKTIFVVVLDPNDFYCMVKTNPTAEPLKCKIFKVPL